MPNPASWLQNYLRQGAAELPLRVSPGELERLSGACATLLGSRGGFAKAEHVADKDAAIFRAIARPDLVQCLARLLGGSVVLEHCKAHRGAPAGSWHRDLDSYPMTTAALATVGFWLADVDQEHGGLAYLGGSHRARRNGASEATAAESARSTCLSPAAGSITVHHGLVLHRALPCQPDRPRIVIWAVYRAAGTRPIASRRTGSRLYGVLLRGTEPPTYGVDADALAMIAPRSLSLRSRGQRFGMM